jgi:hypothetical protein
VSWTGQLSGVGATSLEDDSVVVLGLLAPIVLAGLLAFALGGSPRGWSQQVVRWSPLATFSLIAQAALFFPPIDHQPWVLIWGKWLWVVSMLGVLAMLVRNTRVGKGRLRLAWTVAALGVAANVLVVTVNGGAMPRTIPIDADAPDGVDHLSNVFASESDAPLIWLGDVIAEPDWLPRSNAVSIGDLLLSTGLAGWVFLAALEGTKRRRWQSTASHQGPAG